MHAVRNLALGAIAAAGLAGCAADAGDASLLVLHNQAPSSGCTLSADKTGAFIAAGYLDLNSSVGSTSTVGQGYLMTPLLENTAFADTADPTATARRTAVIHGAHVDISFVSGIDAATQSALEAQGLTQFDALFAGAIDPNYGLTTFAFDAIPADVLNGILNANPAGGFEVGMVATITIYGEIGGNPIESNAFAFPITVCDGCLLDDRGPCSMLNTSFTPREGGACAPNQDGVTDCCTDPQGVLLCPAVGTGGA